MAALLPSSRPRWAMMPAVAAGPFLDMLLFVSSALDNVGIAHIVHYGTLLGAARIAAPLPWDEDHDLFVLDADLESVGRRLQPIMEAHGYTMHLDPRGFWWIRERWWTAASGHLALAILPAPVDRAEELPIWEGGAPHLLASEIHPLRRMPVYGSFIWAPAGMEDVLWRLYGESGSRDIMARFSPPPIDAERAAFWARVRGGDALDWPSISERFGGRSRWRAHLAVPWWWFNGAYILAVGKIRRWAQRRQSGEAPR